MLLIESLTISWQKKQYIYGSHNTWTSLTWRQIIYSAGQTTTCRDNTTCLDSELPKTISPRKNPMKWDHAFQRLVRAASHWGKNREAVVELLEKNIYSCEHTGGSKPHWSGNKKPNLVAVWLTRKMVTLLMMNTGRKPAPMTGAVVNHLEIYCEWFLHVF